MHHPGGDGEVPVLLVALSRHSSVGAPADGDPLQRLKAESSLLAGQQPVTQRLQRYFPCTDLPRLKKLIGCLMRCFLADGGVLQSVLAMDLTAQPLMLFVHGHLKTSH